MKYFLGVLGVILLIIFVFVLIFRGSGTPSATEVRKLAEYAAEPQTVAEFTESGAINGQEAHRTVRIRVTDSIRSVALVKGYNGDVIDRKTYSNTNAAFEAFLAGLEQGGFNKERRTRLSFKSVCPSGSRFSYGLESEDDTVVDTWSASCERGSFGGERTLIRRLFQAQIPDYDEFVDDVRFSL